jgi:DNA-directed RNA polymerase specialized sigma24 family protein
MVHERPLRVTTPHAVPQTRTDGDLTELLHAARAGDERAWEGIVHRFSGTIRGVARRHRLSPAQADDVAQTTWLALLEHIHAVRDAEALGGWIATTAHRACLRAHQGPVRSRVRCFNRLRVMPEVVELAQAA